MRLDNFTEFISTCLSSDRARDGWRAFKAWYHPREGGRSLPSPSEIEKQTCKYEQLLGRTDLDTPNILIPRSMSNLVLTPTEITDDPPSEYEIAEAVRSLGLHRSPGVSGLRAENIKQWRAEWETMNRELAERRKKADTDTEKDRMVRRCGERTPGIKVGANGYHINTTNTPGNPKYSSSRIKEFNNNKAGMETDDKQEEVPRYRATI